MPEGPKADGIDKLSRSVKDWSNNQVFLNPLQSVGADSLFLKSATQSFFEFLGGASFLQDISSNQWV